MDDIFGTCFGLLRVFVIIGLFCFGMWYALKLDQRQVDAMRASRMGGVVPYAATLETQLERSVGAAHALASVVSMPEGAECEMKSNGTS